MAELNVANRTLFHGDNLDFLRGINSGTVHLIATDPPFNKSKDFHATPDSLAAGAKFEDRWSWSEDAHDEWLMPLQKDEPEVWSVITTAKAVYGDDMGAFLCWLGVRLLEMHRILADDGSLYLHIDHTAHAYAKTLLDAIFGRRNFRNEIVWCYFGPANTPRWFPRKHDTLLFYVKSQDAPFHRDAVRVPYGFETLARRGRAEGLKSIISPSVETLGRRELNEVDEGFGRGKVIEDWWTDIAALTNQRENTGYPTQKPLALYERIIKASSNEGDIVLDPFCGCATTPVAAERLGRQWIGIDTWDGAANVIEQRMKAAGFDLGTSHGIPSGRGINISRDLPTRTDRGEMATLVLKMPKPNPRYPTPRTQHGKLLADLGAFCQGCGRNYAFDPRVLEVDHVSPRSDGGTDAYENLTLLCPPCNKEKRDKITLTGLQERNRKEGHLLPQNEGNIRRGRGVSPKRKRRR